MIYKWKEGTRIKTSADIAADVMNELAEKHSLDAATLVDVSRPLDAPLHDEFEWDDQKAAEEFRKHRARNIINSLVQIEEGKEEDSTPIRCFFQVEQHTSLYDSIDVIIKDRDKAELLRKQALRELEAYSGKYAEIIKRVGAETDIDTIRKKISA